MSASTPSPKPAVLIASNRGPVSFGRTESGGVVATRGVGGLVTALSGAVEASDGLWIASALTEEDRLQAERGRMEVAVDGRSFRVRYLRFDPDDFQRFYNAVSNRILWFLHHYLWDLARTPRFGPGARVAWDAYRRVNRTFAETLAEEGASSTGASYLVQDYHLALVPAMLRELEPNARIAYFSHVPFAGPGYFGILPEDLRTELLRGLLGADVVGFHSDRWAENFLLNCRRVPDARVDLHRRTVRCGTRTIRIRVYPIAVDAPALREAARSPAVIAARAELAGELGDQRLILRVDRVELSKNVLRGFLAFERLLDRRPQWRRGVRYLAMLNPSREAIPEYRAYLQECLGAADRINRRLAEPGWDPIEVQVRDDWPAALAGFALYDVLMVNPVFDGMNLVAKEGPLLNRNDGVLILSENAGAFDQLGRHAVVVNPFDVEAQANALEEALSMPREERRRRARALRAAVGRGSLRRWVDAQLRDLDAAVR